MEKKIKYFFNKEINKPLVLVGAGPTMHEFNYANFSGKKLGIGTSILRLENKFKFDYFVSANNEFPVPEISLHLNYINKFKNMVWFMSDTACYDGIWTKSEKFLKENLQIDYCFFDERHFNQKKCKPERKCCDLIKFGEDNNNIYDLLKNKIDYKINFDQVDCTVAEHGLAISILIGANPIFIQGVDLPKKNYQAHKKGVRYEGYNSKYADDILNYTNKIVRKKLFKYYFKNFNFIPYLKELAKKFNYFTKRSSRFFTEDYEKSIQRFENLSLMAKKNNQKIYVLSKNSNLLNLKNFEYINSKEIMIKFPKFFK